MSSMGGGMNMKNMTMTQMSYTVMAGNTSYQVTVASSATLPNSVKFNQDQKSINFDVSGLTTRYLFHYEVTIPSDLLSGNFTATCAGYPLKIIAVPNSTSTTIHINIPSSFVKANGISDSTTIMVMGTQAIPEFGSIAYMIIAISIIGVIVISSKFRLRFS
jgi:predicted secreted protein with PEFG-CTERM motif